MTLRLVVCQGQFAINCLPESFRESSSNISHLSHHPSGLGQCEPKQSACLTVLSYQSFWYYVSMHTKYNELYWKNIYSTRCIEWRNKLMNIAIT